MARGLDAAAEGDRREDGCGLRSRGTVADAGERGADVSLREADLQDPVVPLRRRDPPAAPAFPVGPVNPVGPVEPFVPVGPVPPPPVC